MRWVRDGIDEAIDRSVDKMSLDDFLFEYDTDKKCKYYKDYLSYGLYEDEEPTEEGYVAYLEEVYERLDRMNADELYVEHADPYAP